VSDDELSTQAQMPLLLLLSPLLLFVLGENLNIGSFAHVIVGQASSVAKASAECRCAMRSGGARIVFAEAFPRNEAREYSSRSCHRTSASADVGLALDESVMKEDGVQFCDWQSTSRLRR
jgi:hypothetical protein